MRYFLLVVYSFGLCLSTLHASDSTRIIEIQAKKFEYIPNEIHLKFGEPVVLRLKSLDRKHGFKVPELRLEAIIKAGETVDVPVTPQKKGKFPFHCNSFCGSGHEGMTGTIIVE